MSFENERYVSSRTDKIEALEQEIARLKEQLEETRKQLKNCELTLGECVISDDVGVTARQYFKDKQGEG